MSMPRVTSLADLAFAGRNAAAAFRIEDASSGLLAFLVLDSEALGPAAGGTRTRSYPGEQEALADARGLARAMTHKCALAGLDAGGAKAVVVKRDGWNRAAAFEAYGRAVQQLEGRFHTAGDLGTTSADLRAAATHAGDLIHGADDDEAKTLADAVGATVVACARAAGFRAEDSVSVQGVGDTGAAVASAFAAAAAGRLSVSDLDPRRASEVGVRVGATVVDAENLWAIPTDVFCPCAVGGVLTAASAPELRARILCGAANRIVADVEAERALTDRCVVVPDVLSSSGAVIVGVARSIMRTDPAPLLRGVEDTCRSILEQASKEKRVASEVARNRAEELVRVMRF